MRCLHARIVAFAGLAPGDRVGFLLDNSDEFLIADLACAANSLVTGGLQSCLLLFSFRVVRLFFRSM